MKNDQTQPVHKDVLLNGKPATDEEYKRIYRVKPAPSDPNERATKPIQTVSREFKLLRWGEVMTKTVRGFVIRAHQSGDPEYVDQKQKVWAEKGTLPQEWHTVKQDPQIDQAQIYTNAQSHVRGDKRRILDQK
jgi:hypothetical protein